MRLRGEIGKVPAAWGGAAVLSGRRYGGVGDGGLSWEEPCCHLAHQEAPHPRPPPAAVCADGRLPACSPLLMGFQSPPLRGCWPMGVS